MALFSDIGEKSLRGRRARRLVRAWRRRCPPRPFLLAFLCLAYLAFCGARLPFDGLQHRLASENTHLNEFDISQRINTQEHITKDGNSSIEGQGNNTLSEKEGFIRGSTFQKPGSESNVKRNLSIVSTVSTHEIFVPAVNKMRKRYGPCEVGFTESVETLVEPEDYMNFTRLSLQYITKEEIFYENGNKLESRFGGHQTLEQRENSYYAQNQTIHCGFVQDPEGYSSTGFDLSERDKQYMASCIIVVSSCIFGNSDFLRRPTRSKIGTFSRNNVCFMMFLDELTLKALSSEGHIPDDMGNIGLWRIVVVKTLPFADMRKTGKVPKLLSHRLFPSARYSIWIDSKMRLQADPMLILEYFLWRTRSEYAISNHYERHCVWEEVLQNKRLNKYNHSAIDKQFMFYQSDGLVKFNASIHSSILPSFVPEGSFIVRAHTPMSNLFSCLWFNEVDRFTSRDQLSFAYTFLKLKRMNPGRPFYLNMFKDCERRAMCKMFHHKMEDSHPPSGP